MSKAIFLAAGVPDPRRGPKFAATADTVAITAAVAALTHVVLGRRRLVWGGQPGITPMIFIVAEEVGVDYGQWVQLYQSRFFEDEFPEDNARFSNVCFTDPVADDREASLHLMRERMFSEHEFEAAVFVGGMGGLFDEFALFRQLQPTAAVLPIASTGGAALDLADQIADLPADLRLDRDYISLFHRCLGISAREKRYVQPGLQPDQVEDRFWRPGDRA